MDTVRGQEIEMVWVRGNVRSKDDQGMEVG